MPKETQNKWFVLAVLTAVYTFSFIDRQILVILAEPIKADLNLSDTQLGLLTGLAFAALYITLGLPIARLADKGNRKNVVAVSLTVWSFMTAISGSATSFIHLFLARIGVGVGEAGGSPPSHSMISDIFPPKKRATALSIYSSGIYIGMFLGFAIGGVLAKSFGWRVVFYSIGIPGILLAVFLYFFIKEPIKGQFDTAGAKNEASTLPEVLKVLFSSKAFILTSLGTGFLVFGQYGMGNFMPSFLQRVHGMDIRAAGYVLGITYGLAGGIGSLAGGYLSDRMGAKDKRWYIWVPMTCLLISILPFSLTVFSDNVQLVVVMFFLNVALGSTFLGPAIAVTHSLVDARMRAFASSVLFLIMNFIGLGLGPLVVGYLSDVLTPAFGDLSLRWAFCAIFISASIAVVFYGLGAKNYIKDLQRMQE
ncbi:MULTISPECIES: MFS transporter [unclassified Imperialibacter]|uniref:spinster family MFS transporter n=1 Tax=unclassified Imperialibacter TaxID=2629706 RepID=UPI0012563223|nr:MULTISPECIES: MFS transporter [unclassified Imperialibacter]CAD5251176.1 Predicted arabinose efflux permease, MFS family [Imperialibacter sp. 89]CAD5284145.1 Predicted arabinose efflux permease, MFS family [Imperialibacter sp. 75]VVT10943.1 Predicted arabinose efflux permease, MFS family [Imperialibacter sp. EC-SDR9]